MAAPETFAVIWNGESETFADRRRVMDELAADRRPRTYWWSARTKGGIQAGSIIYIFKPGSEPEVIGHGVATGPFRPPDQIGEPSLKAHGFEIEVLDLVNPLEGLPRDELRAITASVTRREPKGNWVFMASGLRIAPPFDAVLRDAWSWHRGTNEQERLAPELDSMGQVFGEGARSFALVNRFERSAEARRACLAEHGHRCVVCDMDFNERYGPELGHDYNEVHHLHPLSEGGQERTDPTVDLVPVCPNCHAMLQQPSGLLTPAQLRDELKKHS